MRTAKKTAPVEDDYFDLIREFPLRSLRTEKDYEAAGAILNRLLMQQAPRSEGERRYLEALVELSVAYEARAHRLKFEKPTAAQTVKYLMAQSGMNTEALGKVLGSQTAASLFLTGKRPLSKANIFKLAERFKVEPGIFLER
jgi:antitoxin component HigA of HigAB toxin-antitoxin module